MLLNISSFFLKVSKETDILQAQGSIKKDNLHFCSFMLFKYNCTKIFLEPIIKQKQVRNTYEIWKGLSEVLEID